MKRFYIVSFFAVIAGLIVTFNSSPLHAQNIAINKSGTPGNAAAILDLSNNGTLGFALPNVILSDVSVASPVPSPTDGLLVYNTNSTTINGFGKGVYYWSSAISKWVYLQNSGSGSGIVSAANNGISISGTIAQLGDISTASSWPSVFNSSRLITQNGNKMLFDFANGSTTQNASSTVNWSIQNGGATHPYVYVMNNGSTNNSPAVPGPLVGIGTSTPSTMLNVAQNNAISIGNSYLSSGGATYMHLASNAWFDGTNWHCPAASQNPALMQFVNDQIVFYNAPYSALNPAWVQRMTILGTGNVGIATVSPKSILDVAGGISVGSYAGNNAAPANGVIVSGQVGIGTNAPNAGAILDLTSSTLGLLPPRMATAPTSPATGMLYYNTATNCLMMYNGTTWQSITCSCNITETGNPVVTNSGRTVMVTFTVTGTFSTTCALTNVQVLEVGGGGGGGGNGGGGGGGGGVLFQTVSYLASGNYAVTVGTGGAGTNDTPQQSGTLSQFGTLTSAAGGGGGGSRDADQAGLAGGSGGGAGGDGISTAGGAGTAGQGFAGGATDAINSCFSSGGGGGGASAVGTIATNNKGGNGGAGVSFFGTTYGGGGGGGVTCNNTGASVGTGGSGGGGNGGIVGLSNAVGGTANTGGGGGGGGNASGTGGTGVVIVIYTAP